MQSRRRDSAGLATMPSSAAWLSAMPYIGGRGAVAARRRSQLRFTPMKAGTSETSAPPLPPHPDLLARDVTTLDDAEVEPRAVSPSSHRATTETDTRGFVRPVSPAGSTSPLTERVAGAGVVEPMEGTRTGSDRESDSPGLTVPPSAYFPLSAQERREVRTAYARYSLGAGSAHSTCGADCLQRLLASIDTAAATAAERAAHLRHCLRLSVAEWSRVRSLRRLLTEAETLRYAAFVKFVKAARGFEQNGDGAEKGEGEEAIIGDNAAELQPTPWRDVGSRDVHRGVPRMDQTNAARRTHGEARRPPRDAVERGGAQLTNSSNRQTAGRAVENGAAPALLSARHRPHMPRITSRPDHRHGRPHVRHRAVGHSLHNARPVVPDSVDAVGRTAVQRTRGRRHGDPAARQDGSVEADAESRLALERAAFVELGGGPECDHPILITRLLKVLRVFELTLHLQPFHGIEIDQQLNGTLSFDEFDWVVRCALRGDLRGPRCSLLTAASSSSAANSQTNVLRDILGEANPDAGLEPGPGRRGSLRRLSSPTSVLSNLSFRSSLSSTRRSSLRETDYPEVVSSTSAVAELCRALRSAARPHLSSRASLERLSARSTPSSRYTPAAARAISPLLHVKKRMTRPVARRSASSSSTISDSSSSSSTLSDESSSSSSSSSSRSGNVRSTRSDDAARGSDKPPPQLSAHASHASQRDTVDPCRVLRVPLAPPRQLPPSRAVLLMRLSPYYNRFYRPPRSGRSSATRAGDVTATPRPGPLPRRPASTPTPSSYTTLDRLTGRAALACHAGTAGARTPNKLAVHEPCPPCDLACRATNSPSSSSMMMMRQLNHAASGSSDVYRSVTHTVCGKNGRSASAAALSDIPYRTEMALPHASSNTSNNGHTNRETMAACQHPPTQNDAGAVHQTTVQEDLTAGTTRGSHLTRLSRRRLQHTLHSLYRRKASLSERLERLSFSPARLQSAQEVRVEQTRLRRTQEEMNTVLNNITMLLHSFAQDRATQAAAAMPPTHPQRHPPCLSSPVHQGSTLHHLAPHGPLAQATTVISSATVALSSPSLSGIDDVDDM